MRVADRALVSRKAATQDDDKLDEQHSEQTMRIFRFGLALVALVWNIAYGAVPDYAGPAPQPAGSVLSTAVFAGGCFWGVDAVVMQCNGDTDVMATCYI